MNSIFKKIVCIMLFASYTWSQEPCEDVSYWSRCVRDGVFMPLYSAPIDQAAVEFHDFFLERKYQKELKEGRLHVSMKDVIIDGRTFTLKVFECTTPGATEFHNCFYVCGACDDLHNANSKVDSFFHGYFDQEQTKNLRIFAFSYYETHLPKEERWMPVDRFDMGVLPLQVVQTLHEEGSSIDTLFWFSMGGMVCEGLHTIDTEGDLSWLPTLFVSDRGLSSIWKIKHLEYKATFGYPFAYATNWHADPESRLIEFFERMNGRPETPELILFEIPTDYYFSCEKAFDPDYVDQVAVVGSRCYRGLFPTPDTPFHNRAHHNLPFHEIHVLPSSDTDGFIPTVVGESLSHSLVRFMLKADCKCHKH